MVLTSRSWIQITASSAKLRAWLARQKKKSEILCNNGDICLHILGKKDIWVEVHFKLSKGTKRFPRITENTNMV